MSAILELVLKSGSLFREKEEQFLVRLTGREQGSLGVNPARHATVEVPFQEKKESYP